jgi:hypothetical protein
MLLANDNYILCSPLPDKEETTSLGSFLSGDREVAKLEVVFTSKHPDPGRNEGNKLYVGAFIYVRGSFAQSGINQDVHTLDGVPFIRVPFSEVILIESNYANV